MEDKGAGKKKRRHRDFRILKLRYIIAPKVFQAIIPVCAVVLPLSLHTLSHWIGYSLAAFQLQNMWHSSIQEEIAVFKVANTILLEVGTWDILCGHR